MFGIKTMLLLVGWCGVLSATYVAANKLPETSAYLPAALAWDIFAVFLMYAILSAMLRAKNRGFWVGVAIFGMVPLLGDVLHMNSMFQHPSTGRAALEVLGLGLDPDAAGDDPYIRYMFSVVPIADLAIATLSSLVGGLIGLKLAATTEPTRNAEQIG